MPIQVGTHGWISNLYLPRLWFYWKKPRSYIG